MSNSVLTPLQLTAGAGLLQNQGFAINANLTSAINAYTSSPLLAPLLATITASPGVLLPSTITALETFANNTVPALADQVPATYSIPVTTNPPGLTGAITTISNNYLGNGDLSKFAQLISAAQGYTSVTNDFINSAINSQTYLSITYTNMSNMMSGDITQITVDPQALGADLLMLGQLINLDNLDNLGSPFALLQQIIKLVGSTPTITNALTVEGVPASVTVQINDPSYSTTNAIQKLIYTAMTKITGDDLTNILKFMKVTTPNIMSLADLLNPVKILPNSFASLRMPTENGSTPIYVNESGSINTELETLLPSWVISDQL